MYQKSSSNNLVNMFLLAAYLYLSYSFATPSNTWSRTTVDRIVKPCKLDMQRNSCLLPAGGKLVFASQTSNAIYAVLVLRNEIDKDAHYANFITAGWPRCSHYSRTTNKNNFLPSRPDRHPSPIQISGSRRHHSSSKLRMQAWSVWLSGCLVWLDLSGSACLAWSVCLCWPGLVWSGSADRCEAVQLTAGQ